MKKLLFLSFVPLLLSVRTNNRQVTPCYKADIIFVIDYSGSMANTIPYYEPWLRATAGSLPLSPQLKAGLLFFSDDTCPSFCPLTDDKGFFDEKILEARKCPSTRTYIEQTLIFAEHLFDVSQKERGEKVPRIIVLVTDLDVSDHVETCEFVYSYMTETFFILIELNPVMKCQRIDDLRQCITHNGISFPGFVWVYEDLLKQFDPCM